jgi:hypothetical protein
MAEAEMHITEQGWTGWSREQPSPQSRDVRVRTGASILLQALTVSRLADDGVMVTEEEGTELRVDEVTSNGVKLRSIGRPLIVPNDDGALNLFVPPVVSQAIRKGERLILATPAMDSGATWTIEVQAINDEP